MDYNETYGMFYYFMPCSPLYVMFYFPELVIHIMSYVTLFLKTKLSGVNEDKPMSHLKNEVTDKSKSLRDTGSGMQRFCNKLKTSEGRMQKA